jgi:hypothetical protein
MSSPGIFSPGTGAPNCKPGCPAVSSVDVAQPEIRTTTAKNEATGTATRLFMAANVITRKFDASSALR